MFLNNEHSLGLLDFFRIRDRVADYCLSQEGGDLVRASLPTDDAIALERFKGEIGAIAAFFDVNELPSFSFPRIEGALKRLGVAGMTLELDELFAIGLWAKDFDRLVALFSRIAFGGGKAAEAQDCAELPDYDAAAMAAHWAESSSLSIIKSCQKLQHIYKIVFDVLTLDGELRDLPELKRIRDGISRANRDLLTIADSYRGDPDLKSALQSGEPTVRDGRTVLAVRANFRGRVKGIVHEVSATGQTVFIEPVALVEKNNELVQLEAALRAEIFRILKETSESLRGAAPSLRGARSALAELDQRLARALQFRREELAMPEPTNAGYTIWRARHPLLGKKAVPIDVDVPEETRTLIVTGPNTGGKTVTLKTIGLFALMHQFGLGLPAAQGTKLPVFDAVLADIGDEQSIDQSLSTFSGHMKVIAEVARSVSPRSLVLLDELGAGTDPEEGCAIAMGLLDHFIEKGCLTMVTTHHGILKNYGYTRPGCLNASMEFDSARLAPTYRIVMGIPGESRAIEIASQTGLDAGIVAKARGYLTDERTDIGELIRGLTEKHRELESLEREQKKRLKSVTERQRKADLAALRVRQWELELRRHGLADIRGLLTESRKTLENLVRELRESGASTDKTKDVKAFLAEFAESVDKQYGVLEREEREAAEAARDEASAAVADEAGAQPSAGRAGKRTAQGAGGGSGAAGAKGRSPAAAPARVILAEGAEVLYGPSRRRARIIRQASAGKWVIEIGSLKLTVPAGELAAAEEAAAERPAYDVELAPRGAEAAVRASFELDLRGFRLAEALEAVERQVDAASLQGLNLFSIIHGTGEGVLGKGIHDYLRSNAAVDDYHFARPEEGGYGKTIVRLKA
jgi:DNA mismatch repair protein MutS2